MASTLESGPAKPNFLIIVADDLGWSDLGCFGSEISTPNLDQLTATHTAARYTDFHTASACSPTRSMLMSGTDHHLAGLGQMAHLLNRPEFRNAEGYEGQLNDRVAALPELLSDNGYQTIIAGKWHLGTGKDYGPKARGFQKGFSLIPGAANHFKWQPSGKEQVIDGQYEDLDAHTTLSQADLPADYYSTTYFTNRLIHSLKKSSADMPFFAYLAYTAPHWPLQAPPEVIDRYNGFYESGPDALRKNRLKRQFDLGLIDADTVAAPVITTSPEWEDLSDAEKRRSSRTMQTFAAMVEIMDENIGRVVQQLKDSGVYENTVIMFMSDNGADGAELEALPILGDRWSKVIRRHYDNSLANIGNPNSFLWYGARWALAATAPARGYKGYCTEGGIRCPFILSSPLLPNQESIDRNFITVMDILPTILDWAGIKFPQSDFRGRKVHLPRGKSLLPHLLDNYMPTHASEESFGWELFSHQAIRKGSWKALFIPPPQGNGQWQLFNLAQDVGETTDRALDEPETLKELLDLWLTYVAETGMIQIEQPEEAQYGGY